MNGHQVDRTLPPLARAMRLLGPAPAGVSVGLNLGTVGPRSNDVHMRRRQACRGIHDAADTAQVLADGIAVEGPAPPDAHELERPRIEAEPDGDYLEHCRRESQADAPETMNAEERT